jgi:hypothetical protein
VRPVWQLPSRSHFPSKFRAGMPCLRLARGGWV